MNRIGKILLSALVSVTLVQQMVSADAQSDAVKAQIRSDSTLISQWMSDQLKFVLPFNGNAGNAVPGQISFPGFEGGISGYVTGTKFDVDALRNLPTGIVNADDIDTFSRFPFPLVVAHVKAGLPFGLDGGVRLGGVPKTTVDSDDAKVTLKNRIIGLDVRKALIEDGVASPFGLTVGLSYTNIKGSIDTDTDYSGLSGASAGGASNITISNARGLGNVDWDISSIGAQAMVSKKLLIVTPSVGVAVNRNNGSVSTSIRTTGNATYTGGSGSTTLDEVGSASSKVKKWDARLLAGLEFSFIPFTRLGLNVEYAGSKNIGGGLGIRVQFP